VDTHQSASASSSSTVPSCASAAPGCLKPPEGRPQEAKSSCVCKPRGSTPRSDPTGANILLLPFGLLRAGPRLVRLETEHMYFRRNQVSRSARHLFEDRRACCEAHASKGWSVDRLMHHPDAYAHDDHHADLCSSARSLEARMQKKRGTQVGAGASLRRHWLCSAPALTSLRKQGTHNLSRLRCSSLASCARVAVRGLMCLLRATLSQRSKCYLARIRNFPCASLAKTACLRVERGRSERLEGLRSHDSLYLPSVSPPAARGSPAHAWTNARPRVETKALGRFETGQRLLCRAAEVALR